jgi:integrase/recombinase XerD
MRRTGLAESYPTRSTDHHACAGHRDLSDWLAHLRLKNRAARTLDDYERTIAALLLWRDKPVDEYTLEDLEHFVLLKYGATPGARVRMSHLKGFFDFLYKRDRIRTNIAARIEMPKKHGQKVIEVFTDAELALIYATDQLACLLCETGMRKSEARNLQRRHINLKTAELVVYNGKGAKDRVVPLTERALVVIADMDLMDGLSSEDHIWPTKPGGGQVLKRRDPISNTAMQSWWAHPAQGVLARAGVDYRNMHVTRHTFATRLIRRGARIENVQQLMGHSSIQTTVNLYAHLDVEDARAALRFLELEVVV